MKEIRHSIELILLISLLIFNSCEDYLDIVPDNIATIDNAFSSRITAEKYLFTCYSYIPNHAEPDGGAFLTCDEFWIPYPQEVVFFHSSVFETIARGNQNITSPALNYWDNFVFVALRDCNLFLERIDDVPGVYPFEVKRWKAEVKFLKAYYHYLLLRMYGPIPLIKENLPISASVEKVKVLREPVDDCFEYIISLLDEAIPDLPLILENERTEAGRATSPIASAVKAKILVEAASPLFNGNTDYASFKRKSDGVQYFNQTFDIKKWEKAATACKDAIETCHEAGFELYEYQPKITEQLPPEIITQMSIRNSVCDNDYDRNKEVVWMNTKSLAGSIQNLTTPTVDPSKTVSSGINSILAPTLKIAEMFYTENGVPMNEDEEWVSSGRYSDRYTTKVATVVDKYHIKQGAETAVLNFDREIRFYANLGFDTGLWYGIGNFNADNQWDLRAKYGQVAGGDIVSTTGYFCKKLAHFQNVILSTGLYVVVQYPWPIIRLADLYLLYAEALNEANGPSGEVYEYINKVRNRAGLENVEVAWPTYAVASKKQKHTTVDGLREIIQQERLIELANEGHRYWEIRRWKRAKELWHNQPIQGWDVMQNETDTYYKLRNLFVQSFYTKDYLFPIREYNLTVNSNLDQNPGW